MLFPLLECTAALTREELSHIGAALCSRLKLPQNSMSKLWRKLGCVDIQWGISITPIQAEQGTDEKRVELSI